jgi:hypothetical protein
VLVLFKRALHGVFTAQWAHLRHRRGIGDPIQRKRRC